MFDMTTEADTTTNASSSDSYAILPDYSLNSKITDFGLATFQDSYLLPTESPQDLYMRVAKTFGSNPEHTQRLYYYMSHHWFSPATPILSNGGTTRGNCISCFLNSVDDSLVDIVGTWFENVWLGAKGGGTGSNWSNVREIGGTIGQVGATSGIVPFLQAQDALTSAVNQGNLRRSSCAVYLNINHPEIEEFIQIRTKSGGDPRRKVRELHNAVIIDDEFMLAVKNNTNYNLISPHTGKVYKEISARAMWIELLNLRINTGEPYILFKDTVQRATPEAHQTLGLYATGSNLCSEIVLPTGIDHLGHDRTAVCCLSSLNLEYYNEWKHNKDIIPDVLEMLDNILEEFITKADPTYFSKAIYAASRERSVGLGVMGLHSYFQSMNIPFESAVAKSQNMQIFKNIRRQADETSVKLAMQRGACPDAKEAGLMERFVYKLAVAPTATISILCGGTSPGIEPLYANSYSHKTKSGTFTVKNKFLETVLEAHGRNTMATWTNIMQHNGSVQQLNFLSAQEKLVFKTAEELDQNWIIDLAADRAPYIDQSQSLNLFFPPTTNVEYLSKVHFAAWKKGVKSLYYLRSRALKRAENATYDTLDAPIPAELKDVDDPNDVCLACQ